VVANIPYYITSLVIRHLLESKSAPRRMVLTVQKEVAARICADPGEMSMLSLSVQVYGKPVIVDIIPSSAFFPAPNVDSAIVRIDIFPQPVIHPSRLSTFFHLARAGFNQKRKTLRNSLAPVLDPGISNSILLQAGIDPMRRAETLGLDEWKRLTDIVAGEMK
jgi:16S rRNA (adenine1518-N6/adenine1519-N6)-dimethyltransferase